MRLGLCSPVRLSPPPLGRPPQNRRSPWPLEGDHGSQADPDAGAHAASDDLVPIGKNCSDSRWLLMCRKGCSAVPYSSCCCLLPPRTSLQWSRMRRPLSRIWAKSSTPNSWWPMDTGNTISREIKYSWRLGPRGLLFPDFIETVWEISSWESRFLSTIS